MCAACLERTSARTGEASTPRLSGGMSDTMLAPPPSPPLPSAPLSRSLPLHGLLSPLLRLRLLLLRLPARVHGGRLVPVGLHALWLH